MFHFRGLGASNLLLVLLLSTLGHACTSNAKVLTTTINHATASHLQSHPCLVSSTLYTIPVYAFLILTIFIYLSFFVFTAPRC